MDFTLYAGDGVWLLVPDCMVASQTATTKYGPLRPLFKISEKRLQPGEIARILRDVDRDMFSEVPREFAMEIILRDASLRG